MNPRYMLSPSEEIIIPEQQALFNSKETGRINNMKVVRNNGRKGKYNFSTKEFRQYLQNKVDWPKFVKAMLKEALGGYTKYNITGQTYEAAPNPAIMKMILEYAFGRPNVIELSDDDKAQALTQFQQLLSGKTVAEISTNLSTDNIKSNNAPQETDAEIN